MSEMIFYDNDYKNIEEVSKLKFIKCIYIREEPNYLKYNKHYNYYKNFIDNSYYNYYTPTEISNPSNAFGIVEGSGLLEWLSHTKRPVVLFDWDKTITCCDGFMIGDSPFTYESVNVSIQDIMEYLCGGYIRINFLRYIFYCIRKKGEMIVITNNNTAIKNKLEFLKLIRFLDPEFNSKCLIFGVKGNKRLSLINNSYFKTLIKYNNII